jgi:hypothetical protein
MWWLAQTVGRQTKLGRPAMPSSCPKKLNLKICRLPATDCFSGQPGIEINRGRIMPQDFRRDSVSLLAMHANAFFPARQPVGWHLTFP